MTAVDRHRAHEAAAELRGGRWLHVQHGPRTLVVGDRQALSATRLVFAVAGGVAGAGAVLVVAQWAVVIGWVLVCAGIIVGGQRVRVEGRARATFQQRERNARGRHGAAIRAELEDVDDGVVVPVVGAPAAGWGSVTRRQPALPQPDRRLPASGRRALP